jgi:phosphatidylglycerophosphate synthase
MISRRLMKTSVSPNVVTAMALLIGLLSALANLCVDATHLWLLAVGGTLFHLSSVVDGVDGELARLKFQFSPFGAWFDTISDVIINVSYLFTLGFAVWRVTSEPIWVMMSALSLVLALASVLSISRTLKQKGETYLPAMAWSFNDKRDCQTLFQKICRHFAFAARRDFYAFALMVLSFFGIAVAQASVTLTLIIVSFAFGQTLRTQLKLQAQREEIALPERRSTAQLAALKEQTA